jgi:hypothetical protein
VAKLRLKALGRREALDISRQRVARILCELRALRTFRTRHAFDVHTGLRWLMAGLQHQWQTRSDSNTNE